LLSDGAKAHALEFNGTLPEKATEAEIQKYFETGNNIKTLYDLM
jgi:hypothetical protein